jgi:hypothetical protein
MSEVEHKYFHVSWPEGQVKYIRHDVVAKRIKELEAEKGSLELVLCHVAGTLSASRDPKVLDALHDYVSDCTRKPPIPESYVTDIDGKWEYWPKKEDAK